jgi:hypothetical protein
LYKLLAHLWKKRSGIAITETLRTPTVFVVLHELLPQRPTARIYNFRSSSSVGKNSDRIAINARDLVYRRSFARASISSCPLSRHHRAPRRKGKVL